MIHEPNAIAALPAQFWQLPKDSLLDRLDCGLSGLSQTEAERRLQIFGCNHAELVRKYSILHKLGERILNPLIAMLLVAAAVSAVGGDLGSFAIIVAVLALSLTLDIVQEHRAERTAEALRNSVAVEADVFRDGNKLSVPVTELVPGDVVRLHIGDLIPADGIVLEAADLQANEALMTGE